MLAMSCVAMVTGSSDEDEQITWIEVLITGDVHWLVMVRLTGRYLYDVILEVLSLKLLRLVPAFVFGNIGCKPSAVAISKPTPKPSSVVPKATGVPSKAVTAATTTLELGGGEKWVWGERKGKVKDLYYTCITRNTTAEMKVAPHHKEKVKTQGCQ